MFRSGVEKNPGPNSPPKSIDPNVMKMTQDIIERGRTKQRGGARKNAGRGARSESFRRDLKGPGLEEYICDCGKIYATGRSLIKHQIDCSSRKLSSPEDRGKRRPTPSPLKTPRSAGSKLLKFSAATPVKSQLFNLSIKPFNEFEESTVEDKPNEVYKEDKRMECMLESRCLNITLKV